MKKTNKNFARKTLLTGGVPDYAPSVLRIATHHHSEGEDPDTGEHWSRDWDTYETKPRPSASDYLSMGYPRIVDEKPSSPPEEGYRYVARGWVEGDDALHVNYVAVPIPAPTVSDYDQAMEEHLRTEREARGYTTREPDSYLSSSVPRWAQDARDWVAHRDAVMEYALGVMNTYAQTGVIPSLEEFESNMPVIEWTWTEEGE